MEVFDASYHQPDAKVIGLKEQSLFETISSAPGLGSLSPDVLRQGFF